MPGTIGNISACSLCCESFKFYNNLDKYFHFLRHYNEKRLIAGSRVDDFGPREKQRNVELVAQLKTLVNYHKDLSQNDPKFKVPPGSTDWLDDTELARLQAMVSAMDRNQIKPGKCRIPKSGEHWAQRSQEISEEDEP
eukprot:GFUD01072126.1.p1 GENE.GFUD01072126.1~~GFUD01072126.1.p1  ORF type:complete len:138 (-),score=24.20 GFUD01072126.1:56-469(-)